MFWIQVHVLVDLLKTEEPHSVQEKKSIKLQAYVNNYLPVTQFILHVQWRSYLKSR